MADNTERPKKAAGSAKMDEIQRRAQAIANRKPVGAKQFLEEAWEELKKTKWPDRETLIKSTTVVLALVLSVAVWVGGLDFIFGKLLNPLFSSVAH